METIIFVIVCTLIAVGLFFAFKKPKKNYNSKPGGWGEGETRKKPNL